MSISELAEKAGLKRSTIQSYIFRSGGKSPASASLESIVEILRAFPEVSTKWIVLGDGSMLDSDKEQALKNASVNVVAESTFEVNADFKEKYHKANEKIIQLQDELILAHSELINCLKSRINKPVSSGIPAQSY